MLAQISGNLGNGKINMLSNPNTTTQVVNRLTINPKSKSVWRRRNRPPHKIQIWLCKGLPFQTSQTGAFTI